MQGRYQTDGQGRQIYINRNRVFYIGYGYKTLVEEARSVTKSQCTCPKDAQPEEKDGGREDIVIG